MTPFEHLIATLEQSIENDECFPDADSCPFEQTEGDMSNCTKCAFHQVNAPDVLKRLKTIQLLGIQNVETNRNDKTDGGE